MGRFIYLSQARPNIAFAMNLASKSMHQSNEAHLHVTLRII